MKTLTSTLLESFKGLNTGPAKYVKLLFTALLFLTFFSQQTFAASGITYTGRILDSNNEPVSSSNVRFTVTIYDPLGKCWLYTEQRQLDLSLSSGTFSFDIGSNDSTLVPASASYNNDAATAGVHSMADVFSNVKTFSGLGNANTCTGTYTPNPSDPTAGRIMAIYFSVNNGPAQALPTLKINPVPSALTVAGYGTGELLKVGGTVNQTTNANNALSQAEYDEFWRLVKNPATAYLPLTGDVTLVSGDNKLTSLLGQTLPAGPAANNQILVSNGSAWTLQPMSAGSVTSVTGSTPITVTGTASAPIVGIQQANTSQDGYLSSTDWNTFNNKQSNGLADGAVWIGNSSGGAQARVMSGDATISNTGAVALTAIITAGTTGSSGYVPVITYDAKGRITSVTSALVNDSSKLPLLGGTMAGSINMGGFDITNTGNISMGANKYFTLSNNSTNGNSAGQMWFDGTNIKYYDGSGVQTLGVQGAGVTSINGSTQVSQTFLVPGVTGTAPNWTFNAGAGEHTLNIPMASTAAVTAGLISKTDYDSFNAKQSNILADSYVWIGNSSGGAQARQLSGDATVSNSGVLTVDKTQTAVASKILQLDASSVATTKGVNVNGSASGTIGIRGQAAAGAYTLTLPNTAGAANQFLQTDGTGALSWATQSALLPGLADSFVWIGNSSGGAEARSISGDATISNSGVLTVDKTQTAQASKILQLNASSVAVTKGTDIGGAGAGVLSVRYANSGTSTTLTFPGSVGGANTFLQNDGAGNLTWTAQSALLPVLNAGTVWVGNSSNGAEARALSGDIFSTSDTGLVTVVKTTTGEANKILALDGTGVANVKGLDVQTGAGKVTLQTAGAFTNYILTMPTAQGGANQVMVNDGAGNLSWMNPLASINNTADLANGKIWVGNASGKAVEVSMSGDATISNTGALTLASTITAGGPVGNTGYVPVITYDAKGRLTAVTSALVNDTSKLPLAGGTMAGAIDMGGFDITNTGNISMAANKYFTLSTNNTNGTASGQMWFDAGNIKYFDGSSVKTLGVQGAGVTSINGSTQVSQSFLTPGTSGNAPAWSTNAGTGEHTLNIPMASASGSVTAGLISNAEYAAKQSNALTDSYVWIGNSSGGAQARQLSGDATVSNTGAVTVDKTQTAQASKILQLNASSVAVTKGTDIGGAGAGVLSVRYANSATSTTLTFPGTVGGANTFLQTDGAGNLSWAAQSALLPGLADTNMWVGNSSGGPEARAMSGDATMSNTGAVTVDKTQTAVASKILQLDASSVATTKGVNVNGSASGTIGIRGQAAAGAYTLTLPNTAGAANQFLQTDGTGALSWATQSALLPGLADATIWVGNSSGGPQARAMSGDATISNAGVLTVDKTQTGAASKILQLDSSSVANMYGAGIKGATTGIATLSAPNSFSNYTLTLPADDGNASQVLQTNGSGVLTWASVLSGVSNTADLTDAKMWVGNASGKAVEVSMSGDATMSNTGVLTLASTITAGGPVGNTGYIPVITYDAKGRLTAVTSALVNDTSKLPLAGGTMSGAINMGAQDITNTGNISMANNKYFTLSNNTTNGTASGQMWFDGGLIKYYDGSGVKTLGVQGAGVTSINGSTQVSQSFMTPGTSGTAPAWSTNAGTGEHTLNIPMASTAAVTAGLISKSDYDSFSAKQSNALADTNLWVGNSSGGAQARAMSGDATMSNTGAVTVDKTQTAAASKILQLDASSVATTKGVNVNGSTSGSISLRGQAAAGTYTLTLPNTAGSANQFLQTDGTGALSWAAQSALLPGLADTNMWVGNSSGGPQARAMSGDATMSNTGVVTVDKTQTAQASKILQLNASSVAVTKGTDIGGAGAGVLSVRYANSGTSTTLTFPGAVGGANQFLQNDGTGNLTWASPAATLPGLADATIWVGNSSGGPQARAMSGDATISNAGVLTVDKTQTGAASKILQIDSSSVANMYAAGIKGNTTGIATVNAPTSFSNYTLTLPADDGNANQVLQTNGSGVLTWASVLSGVSNTADLASAKIWVGNASGKAVEVSMSGDATMSNTGALTLASTITAAGPIGTSGYIPVITYDAKGRLTAVTSAAVNDTTKLPLAGGTMSGAINMGGQDITNTGDITMAASKYFTLSSNGTNGSSTGQMWFDSGNIKYFDGSSVKTLGVQGAGITSINGSTQSSHSFMTPGTSGTAPAWSINAAAGQHTLNIPMASAAGVTAGLISKTDYDAFTAKQSNALADTNLWVGNSSGGAQARAMSGDATMSNTGAVTVDKTQTAAASKILQLTASSVAVTKGADIGGAGAGAVSIRYANSATNTTLTFPAAVGGANTFLQNDGSGVLSWVSQSALLPGLADTNMWVGNSSGGPQARAMSGDATMSNTGVVTVDKTQTAVASKILQLDASSVATTKGVNVNGSSSGSISLRGQAAAGTYTLTLPNTAGSANQFLQTDGTGALTWAAPAATLPGLTDATIWVGNSSNGPQARAMSGDATISNAGVLTVDKTQTGAASKILQIDSSSVANMYAAGIKGNTTGIATLKAPNSFSNYTLTLPADDGTANQVLQTDGAGVMTWASVLSGVSNTADLASSKMWVGNASGKAVEVSMSGDATMSNTGAVTLASTITAAGPIGTSGYIPVITYDAKGRLTTVTSALVNDTSKLPLAGGTMSGAINMGGQNITNTGDITMAASKYFTLSSNGTNGSSTGQMWFDSGNIKYFDGSSVKTLGVQGAGITSINGSTVSTQTFMTPGTAGTAPAWSINAGAGQHTLNIPMASAAGVTAGLISKTDYDAFNNKQSNALTDSYVWIGNSSGGAQARQISGDATVSNTGVVTVDKTQTAAASKILQLDASSVATTKGVNVNGSTSGSISLRGQAAAGTYTLTLPNTAGSANQFLQTDGTGVLTWAAQSALLPGLADTNMWVGNSSGGAQARAMSGDATMSNTGAVTVDKTQTGAASKILQLDSSSVANMYGAGIKGATTGIATLKAPNSFSNYTLTLPADDGAANQVLQTDGAGVMTWATVLTGVTNTAALTDAKMWVGNASGKAAEVSMSGDATMSNTGAVTLASTITAGSVGAGAYVPVITYDAKGRLTAVTSAAVNDASKLPIALADTNMWVGNSSGGAQARAMSGDATMSNTGAVTVDKTQTAVASKILQLNASSVAVTKGEDIGGAGAGIVSLRYPNTATNTTLTFPNSAGSANQVLKTDGAGLLSWATVLTGVTDTASLTSAKMWVGNASGKAAEVSMSGDATMSNTGAVTLASTITAAGPIGTSGYIPVITYDAKGRLTTVTSAAVNDTSKLPIALADTNMWVGNSSGGAQARAMSGDATMSNTGAVTVDKTQTAVASKILQLDASSVATTKGVNVNGSSSGSISLRGQAAAGTYTLTFPNTAGSANQFLQTDGTGALSWAVPSAALPGLADTNMWVGNSSGGAQARAMSGDATMSNTGAVTVDKTQTAVASKILQLNASSVAVTKGEDIGGGSTGIVSLRYPSTATNTTLTFPSSAGSANQVLKTDGAGLLSWATVLTGVTDTASLTSAKMWVGNASGKAAEVSMSGDATMSNTGAVTLASTITAAGPIGTSGYIPVITYDAKGRLTTVTSAAVNDTSKLPIALADTNMWVGNSSGGAQARAMSGDATMSNTGAVTVDKTQTGAASKILQIDSSSVANMYAAGIKGNTTGIATIKAPTSFSNYTLTLPADDGAANQVLQTDGAGVLTWVNAGGSTPLSSITAATTTNVIDNLLNAQTWNWTTATTQSPMSMSANALTTGSLLNLTTSSASLNSTNGLLQVANTGASTNGIVARIQSNSTAGSGLTVLANGYVGVGNASPGVPFEVKQNTTGTLISFTTNTNNGTAAQAFSGVKNDAGLSAYMMMNGSGYTGSAGAASQGMFSSTGAGGTGIGNENVSGSIKFYTSGIASGNERMRIDSSGNVGIGTNNPTNLLEVAGATVIGGTLSSTAKLNVKYNSNTSGGKLTVTNHNSGVAATSEMAVSNDSGATGSIWVNSSGNTTGAGASSVNIGTASGPLYFWANGFNPLMLSNAGNVGVGTSSPSTKLDTSGVTRSTGFDVNSTFGGSQVSLRAPASFTSYTLTLPTSAGSANQVLQTNGSGVLSWAAAGADATKLPLAGGTMSGAINMGSQSITAADVISAGNFYSGWGNASTLAYSVGGDSGLYLPATSTLAIVTNSTEKMRIDSSGNVSIGTTNNSAKLTVAGTLQHATNYPYNIAARDSAAAAQNVGGGIGFEGAADAADRTFAAIQGGHESATASSYDGYLRFLTRVNGQANLTERMRITSTGMVGIGGTPTTEKLEVTGNIKASGQIYAASNADTDNSIDFNLGNVQSTSYDCAGGAITLNNMKSGGSYTLVVTSATTNQCNFNEGGSNFAAASYAPANTTRTASSHTVYTFVKVGSRVYVSWIAGFSQTQ